MRKKTGSPITVTHCFDDLQKYLDNMTPTINKSLSKAYLKEILKPYAQQLSRAIIQRYPKVGARRYLKGKTRKTTGRLSMYAKSETSKPHVRKVDKNRHLGYFYVPKGDIKIPKSKNNKALRPMPFTYFAWITYGTASHNIGNRDIRQANIISRINYYQKRIEKQRNLASKELSEIATGRRKKSKDDSIKYWDEKIQRSMAGLDRTRHMVAQRKGKIVKGIEKWNYLNEIRSKINNEKVNDLTQLILNDMRNYFDNLPSLIGKKILPK